MANEGHTNVKHQVRVTKGNHINLTKVLQNYPLHWSKILPIHKRKWQKRLTRSATLIHFSFGDIRVMWLNFLKMIKFPCII